MYFDEKRGKARIYVPGVGKKWLPGTFDSPEEAEKLIPAFMNKVRYEAGFEGPAVETNGEFVLRWVNEYPRPKRSTQRNYETMARQFAKDTEPIKAENQLVVVSGIRPADTTRAIARAYALKRPSLRSMLSAMFTDILNFEHKMGVEANPFWNLRLPQSKGRKDIKALYADEVELLAETALEVYPGEFGYVMRGIVLFLGYVGCRVGEGFALKRSWLDYKDETVNIQTRLYVDEDSPKNWQPRMVVLPPRAAQAVQDVPVRCRKDRVFLTPTGKEFRHKSQINRYWTPLRAAFESKLSPERRAELREHRPIKYPHLTLAEMRHFAATYQLDVLGLTPEDVAWQLGHQDGGELVRTRYGHRDERLRLERVRRAFRAEQQRKLIKPVDNDIAEGRAS